MQDKLQVGDTIKCSSYNDMMDTLNELRANGYVGKAELEYTIRIQYVPEPEQDGFITWD